MPPQRRKTIALMFAGGSILSRTPKAWERVKTASGTERWLENFPELRVIADVKPSFIIGDGAPSDHTTWSALGERIKQVLPTVDGVLVLHGLDTLHYAANALSLMVQSSPIPIVLTASPFRFGASKQYQAEFGARANIINAAHVAVADLAEVCVVFGNKILRASRLTLAQFGTDYRPFTVDHSVLGRMDFGTTFDPGRARRSARRARFATRLDPEVYVMTAGPGSRAPLRTAIEHGIHAVLVHAADDSIGIPAELEVELVRAVRASIPVVVASRSRIPLQASLIPLVGTSPSMAVVKTMWARGVTASHAVFRRLIERDVAGEIQGKGKP